MRSFLLFVIALLALVVACVERDDDRDDECPTPRATCIAGQQISCPCLDGTMGIQSCHGDGHYGICQCNAAANDSGIDSGINVADASVGDAKDAASD